MGSRSALRPRKARSPDVADVRQRSFSEVADSYCKWDKPNAGRRRTGPVEQVGSAGGPQPPACGAARSASAGRQRLVSNRAAGRREVRDAELFTIHENHRRISAFWYPAVRLGARLVEAFLGDRDGGRRSSLVHIDRPWRRLALHVNQLLADGGAVPPRPGHPSAHPVGARSFVAAASTAHPRADLLVLYAGDGAGWDGADSASFTAP
jgi:hypothetical protein